MDGSAVHVVREPLLLPLAGVTAGICLAQTAEFSVHESCAAAILLAGVALLSYFYASRWLTLVATFLAALGCGACSAVLHQPGPPPEIDATSEETVILSGCVIDPPVFTADRERFTVELDRGASARVALALRPGDEPPKLNYGQKVEFPARVRRPRNFGNPGAFNYVRYLARQQIYWTASVRAGTPIQVLEGACGSRVARVIFSLRQSALERIDQLYPADSYASGMMDAILIGESTRLEKVWTEHFRRTGTYHALVISGLHVTVLAGVLLFLLRMCLIPEIPALAIAAIGAWLYAGVSGWSAPVVRAAGGFTLYLIGRYFFRRGRVLNLLAAIALAYLLADPGQIFDASFQLSFFSVAAIGAFAVPLLDSWTGVYRAVPRDLDDSRRDARMPPAAAALRVELRLLAETIALWTPIRKRWSLAAFGYAVRFGLWILEMVLVSAVVQVALALPMAILFHRVSITGLSANLLIVPLLSGVVPIGFAAIFTGWHWIGSLSLLLLKASEAVANWHVRYEPGLRIPNPPVWLSAVVVVSLVATALILRVAPRWKWLAITLNFGLFALLFASPFAAELAPSQLELTAIDVGQGDSLLVVFPEGRTMLVDTGGVLAFGRRAKPRLDIGEDVVSQYLWSRRIHRLDVVAITHAHADHMGGLTAVLDNFHPAELWTGATPETEDWTTVERHARDLGVRIVRMHAGDRRDYIEVLAPLTDYEPAAAARNNDSLAMRLTFGAHSFLLMGDMERQIEYQLVAAGAIQPADVLKVAHHGSKTSTTDEFLNAAQPELAMISAGFENSFHHPHPDIVGRLGEHHAFILRTDLDGLVTVRTDGKRLSVIRPAHIPGVWQTPFAE